MTPRLRFRHQLDRARAIEAAARARQENSAEQDDQEIGEAVPAVDSQPPNRDTNVPPLRCSCASQV